MESAANIYESMLEPDFLSSRHGILTRWGPMTPQMILALKKTFPPGQVKWEACFGVQMPSMLPKAH